MNIIHQLESVCRIRSQEAKAKQLEAVKHKLYSPRSATPCVPDKSPVKQDIVNENYLKKNELALSSAGDKQPALGAFEMAYTRKGQESKIKKLLEKQKKKAERMNNKKYQGFGDTKAAAAATEEEMRKKEKREQKKKEQVLKKAQVSQKEVDLMTELLKIGDSAVAEAEVLQPSAPSTSASTSSAQVVEAASSKLEVAPASSSFTSSNLAASIRDFEESQTIGSSGDTQNLSEELDTLFELNVD